ncbi:WYL domain-containing protein [Iodobacter sp. LRB]|uniref:helix-turn-helix transcriptional regulator n=1 Tax=unclassified Iodobacter TaxID=235634 RepID=UPI000C0D8D09|nr:WYL domain-containing protein [Iodobacter sp. BJB302]PHV01287.1 DNA-binding protein [Iodobacter sp. BJB302]
MKVTEHDTLAFRIAAILLKLNQGETFSRQDLANEFNVSERTIYRDLNRLGGIVNRLKDDRYQLAAEYKGKFTSKDLNSFAKLMGVENLFPNTSQRFLTALLDTLAQSSILVKGHQYEQSNDQHFNQLDQAIRQKSLCHLQYAGKARTLAPYRLVNSKGIWYLAASENQQLKTFTLSKISQLHISTETFTPQKDIQQEIELSDDIWYSQEKTEVLLTVAPQAAYYFLRRKLLPEQEIVKEMETGGLIISSQIGHSQQILPLIRYWIPHLKIVTPTWLHQKLVNELLQYPL